jgi:Flp pilus assembly protein TadG
MASQYCNAISKKTGRSCLGRYCRSGAVALEFAILAIPFFMWVLFIFELGYDLFTQEAFDRALHAAVRQIQTGNAQGVTSGQAFINSYLCPAARGLLECANMSISVTTLTGAQIDYSYAPPPHVPIQGNTVVPFNDGTNGAFCNATPKQSVLVEALYIGPSFIGGLLPGVLSARYNGAMVHPTLSTAAFVVEPYSANPLGKGAAPQC